MRQQQLFVAATGLHSLGEQIPFNMILPSKIMYFFFKKDMPFFQHANRDPIFSILLLLEILFVH